MQTESDFSQQRWGALSAIFLLPETILIFTGPAQYHYLPAAKIGEENFQKVSQLLPQHAPPNLIRTTIDYPL